jgi:hypothetical protein
MRGALASALLLAASATPGGLYGLTERLQLVRVADNGTFTPVGIPHSAYAQAQQLSCIDSESAILYFIGYDLSAQKPMVVGLDLATGAQLSAVPLPFAENNDVGVGQMLAFEPHSKSLISGGQDADLNHIVGLIEPITGAWTLLVNLSHAYRNVFGAASVYVPTTRRLLFDLDVDILSVDLVTRKVAVTGQNYTWNILGMNFDNRTGDVYGLAGGPGEGVRTVVRLDPRAMNISHVGDVPDYANQSGGITAMCEATQSIYWIAQKTGAPFSSPWYLVRNSIKDGKTLSVSDIICAQDAACPWSLHCL